MSSASEDFKSDSEVRQANSEHWKDGSRGQLVQSSQGEVHWIERY